jgi:hypothetical protein
MPMGLIRKLTGLAKGFASGVRKLGPKGAKIRSVIPGTHEGKKQMFRKLFKDPLGSVKRSLAPKQLAQTSKELVTQPIKTVREGWKSKRFTKGEALLMGAILPGEMKRIQEAGKPGGPTKAEVAGGVAGDLAGWMAFSKLPLLGQLAGWTLTGYAGRKAGKAIGQVGRLGRKAGETMAEKLEKKSSLRDYARAYLAALEGDTDE